MYKLELEHYVQYYICKEEKYVFANLQKFEVRKSQKDRVCILGLRNREYLYFLSWTLHSSSAA